MDYNELGMREIDRKEAAQLGVDMSMTGVCKKIRRLAKLDRLTLDESEHRSGLNKHLFNYIEYCQMSVIDYIREYLSNLQPYMIERRLDQEKEKSFICVIDKMYRVSVYIKLDNTQFEEMIISFHEDNIRGVAKTNSIIRNNSNSNLVPVIADSYSSVNHDNGNVSINIFAQRGMKILPISLLGIKCEDVFIVRQGDIDRHFVEYCNQYIRDLYTSNLDLNYDEIEAFTMLQQISFTPYGKDTFSSVSLLIDSLITQNDSNSKRVADFALVTYVQELKLTSEQKNDLLMLLDEKYMVTSIKSIDEILFRIKSVIGVENTLDPFEKDLKKLNKVNYDRERGR